MNTQVIVFLGLIAVCVCLPAGPAPYAVILRSNSDVREDGYEFGFETSDPIIRNEVGRLQQIGQDQYALQVSGDFAFNFPDGISFQNVFQADENGYRPKYSFGQRIGAGKQRQN